MFNILYLHGTIPTCQILGNSIVVKSKTLQAILHFKPTIQTATLLKQKQLLSKVSAKINENTRFYNNIITQCIRFVFSKKKKIEVKSKIIQTFSNSTHFTRQFHYRKLTLELPNKQSLAFIVSLKKYLTFFNTVK